MKRCEPDKPQVGGEAGGDGLVAISAPSAAEAPLVDAAEADQRDRAAYFRRAVGVRRCGGRGGMPAGGAFDIGDRDCVPRAAAGAEILDP